jgi:DNA-directed RNA polymerase specialized sigma24 family protein
LGVTQARGPRHRRDVDAADGEVYRKYAEDLTRFATGMVGPSHASDIVSEAVLNCLISAQWPTVAVKRSYLYRCVYNQARSSG